MEALTAMYGDESDEELSSESLSDIEKQAEERALTLSSDIGTSGLLTFLQACPEYMQLRVDPKYINADWEANKPIGYEPLEPFDFWAGPEVPLPYHTIVVGRGGTQPIRIIMVSLSMMSSCAETSRTSLVQVRALTGCLRARTTGNQECGTFTALQTS
jgi:hypothetical protein